MRNEKIHKIFFVLLILSSVLFLQQCGKEYKCVNQWSSIVEIPPPPKFTPSYNRMTVQIPDTLVFEIDVQKSQRFRWNYLSKQTINVDVKIAIDIRDDIAVITAVGPVGKNPETGEVDAILSIRNEIMSRWKYKPYKTGTITLNFHPEGPIRVVNTMLKVVPECAGMDIRNGSLDYKTKPPEVSW